MNGIRKLIFLLHCLLCIVAFVQAQQIIPLKDTARVTITVTGNYIYNDSAIIGTYNQKSIDTDFIFLQVYNRGHSRIAEVTHEQGTATWTIMTPVDQNKMYAPYNTVSPLIGLFRYLVLKGYL